jgi:PAS domain S-box-containing protein
MAAVADRRPDLSAEVTPEQVLTAVLETCDDAIFTVGAECGIADWGTTAERLFGLTSEDALSRPLHHLFPPHLRGDVQSVTSRALSGERIVHLESEIIRGDGLPLPVWVSLCPIPEGSDRPWGVLAIARDITEQHLAQASLAEVEGRLRDAEALAHVGSWLWDLRTGTVQWSTEFHRIHGVDPFEFDGTFTSHLGSIHPDDREHVRSLMEESVGSARPFESEYRILRSDGEVRVLRIRAHPSVGSDGASVGLRGIGQDVTDGPPAPA